MLHWNINAKNLEKKNAYLMPNTIFPFAVYKVNQMQMSGSPPVAAFLFPSVQRCSYTVSFLPLLQLTCSSSATISQSFWTQPRQTCFVRSAQVPSCFWAAVKPVFAFTLTFVLTLPVFWLQNPDYLALVGLSLSVPVWPWTFWIPILLAEICSWFPSRTLTACGWEQGNTG